MVPGYSKKAYLKSEKGFGLCKIGGQRVAILL